MACPSPVGAQLGPCIGLEGTIPYRVFGLSFENFDVPRHYVGIDGRPEGHIFIEARKVEDAPKKPCIGGRQRGASTMRRWRTHLYVCPEDSPHIERTARHGEGVYVGHVLLEWKVMGVEYIVSAHGHTTANIKLVRQLVRSVAMVQPMT